MDAKYERVVAETSVPLVDEIARLVAGIANHTITPEQIRVSAAAVLLQHQAFQVVIAGLLGDPDEPRDPLLEFIEDNDAGPSDAVRLAKLRAKQAQEAALPDENSGAQSTPDSTSGQPT